MAKNTAHWYRCYECGGSLNKIGNVPPKSYECWNCGNVIKMTEENKIRCKNVDYHKRRDYTISRDKYPTRLKPSFAKLNGDR